MIANLDILTFVIMTVAITLILLGIRSIYRLILSVKNSNQIPIPEPAIADKSEELAFKKRSIALEFTGTTKNSAERPPMSKSLRQYNEHLH